MKRILILIAFASLVANGFAEVTSEEVVKTFARVLDEYYQTRDKGVCCAQLDKLCHKRVKCRVENDLMKFISEKSHFDQTEGTYLYDTYINEIFKMIDTGYRIKIENVQYDYEMLNLGLVEGKADYISYDVVVTAGLSTNISFKDVAIVKEEKITAIYQHEGLRAYTSALYMLFPELNNFRQDSFPLYEIIRKPGLLVDVAKSQSVFSILRKIAGNSYGEIAAKCMEMIVSMEMADIGCDFIGKYAKKLDIANYFVHYTKYINIEKLGKGIFFSMGESDLGYIVGPGETTANVKYYRHHPYFNNKGSNYFHYIFPKYRPLPAINLPYLIRKGDFFGFVSDMNEQIVECKYLFAYPFDNQSKLSAVRDDNYKWGFIDVSGRLVIPHIYNVVNDVFVEGKTFVIKDDYLILIDKKGEELRRIYGYNYLIPKLQEKEIIAFNAVKRQYDVYDFCGNLLLEDCFNKDNLKKKEYQRFLRYGEEIENYYMNDDAVETHSIIPPLIPTKITISDITSGDVVDLGIGVLWASKNLGALSCTDVGTPHLWGDSKLEYSYMKINESNGEKYEKIISRKGIPFDIAGTCWDTATEILGKQWRMPNKEDWQRLLEECRWDYCILDGKKGYRIIGKNGNSIFLPLEGLFIYENFEGNKSFDEPEIAYWSSSKISVRNGPDVAYTIRVSPMRCFISGSGFLSFWNYIRPIKRAQQ